MRTQVAIIGGGPAGLLLSHLLHLQGIDSVVLESRDRGYVERRQRAGMLEQGTTDVLRESGVGERLDREGLVHHGLELRFGGAGHRVPLTELTGRTVTVYAQTEIVKDLVAKRLADGGDVRFEAEVVGLDPAAPSVTFRDGGGTHTLDCDYIAGCDGFHGVSRPAVPGPMLVAAIRISACAQPSGQLRPEPNCCAIRSPIIRWMPPPRISGVT